MKKIGIIGSGIVAKTLGNGFLKHGYEVMLSSSDVTKLNDWKLAGGPNALIGSFNDAAKHSDLLVLAVKGEAALEVLRNIEDDILKGKIIIDTTNPIDSTKPPVNGVLEYFTNNESSLMEIFQTAFSDTYFVKAFNSIGSSFMVNPDFVDGKPTMFICGNNEDAKTEVKEILDLFGFETEDLGRANAAGPIEQLCILWCIPGFLHNKWHHAFKLLKK